MDEVDFTILAATSVFGDLTEKCPPAEACREAFDRTAKATIKMANSKGGFGRMPPAPLQPAQLPAQLLGAARLAPPHGCVRKALEVGPVAEEFRG